jgi:hypothetical protein
MIPEYSFPALIYRDMKHLKRYKELFEELEPKDFIELEDFADELFSELGLDIVLTNHFKQRVNDWRENRKPITFEELEQFFLKAYKNAGKDIKKLPHNKEVVLRDHWTKLNSPIIVKDRGSEKDVLMQTIMRKKDFGSPDPIITI